MLIQRPGHYVNGINNLVPESQCNHQTMFRPNYVNTNEAYRSHQKHPNDYAVWEYNGWMNLTDIKNTVR